MTNAGANNTSSDSAAVNTAALDALLGIIAAVAIPMFARR
jgi:hypothetical protein